MKQVWSYARFSAVPIPTRGRPPEEVACGWTATETSPANIKGDISQTTAWLDVLPLKKERVRSHQGTLIKPLNSNTYFTVSVLQI